MCMFFSGTLFELISIHFVLNISPSPSSSSPPSSYSSHFIRTTLNCPEWRQVFLFCFDKHPGSSRDLEGVDWSMDWFFCFFKCIFIHFGKGLSHRTSQVLVHNGPHSCWTNLRKTVFIESFRDNWSLLIVQRLLFSFHFVDHFIREPGPSIHSAGNKCSLRTKAVHTAKKSCLWKVFIGSQIQIPHCIIAAVIKCKVMLVCLKADLSARRLLFFCFLSISFFSSLQLESWLLLLAKMSRNSQ